LPSLSYNFFEFNLIHLSIKQLPGPRSLLKISKFSLISVMLEMPPIFNIDIGILIFFLSNNTFINTCN